MHLRSRRQRGFTLVEIMVVVLIISLLAMVAIPSLMRIQRRAKTTAIMNDFRVFAAAFSSYAQETGQWPPDTAAGVLPPLMAGRIKADAFTRTTPMGGKYNWEYNQTHFGVKYKAAISITATASAPLPLDVNQLTDLENHIDSQFNWLDGSFHLGTGI